MAAHDDDDDDDGGGDDRSEWDANCSLFQLLVPLILLYLVHTGISKSFTEQPHADSLDLMGEICTSDSPERSSCHLLEYPELASCRLIYF